MSDLKDALTDIRGVGDATAESILEVLAEHDTTSDSPLLDKAVGYAQEGDDRNAAVWMKRYADE